MAKEIGYRTEAFFEEGYHTYSTEQINELFGAIQSALDETKVTFTTTNAEKKKLFTFSA